MSDQAVRAAIEQMEAWVLDPSSDLEPEAVASWNAAFLEAVATAERGPGWQDLVARAHALGGRVEARTVAMTGELDALRTELNAQSQGARALRGYAPNLG